MEPIENQFKSFKESNPKGISDNMQLYLVEMPIDFDIHKLAAFNPKDPRQALEEDGDKIVLIKEFDRETSTNLLNQIIPVTFSATKQRWEIKRKFKSVFKIQETYRLPKIKKKAYRKVVPVSLKRQKDD